MRAAWGVEGEAMSRKIGIAAIIYGVSILLSRMIGLLREAVIGRTLGGGSDADVYWAAFVLPDFLNYLLAGGVLSLVFIPIFHRHLAADRPDRGWEAFSVITNFLLIASVAGTVVLAAVAPQLTHLVAPGMSPEQHETLARLIRIMLPAQIFHLVGGSLSATLQARDRHFLPALAPLLYTGCIVVFGIALGETHGPEGFAWGVLVGSVLGPFGTPLVGNLRAGLGWRPLLSVRHPDFRRYFMLALPVMLGFSVVVLDDMVIKHFASEVGQGVISRLQYAKTLMKVPMGMFGLAAGIAAFPTLTRLVAEARPTEAYQTLVRALRMTLVLACTAQVALTVAGAEIATVIWGTRRFAPPELVEIGELTALVCLGLWAWSAQGLVARGFYASQRTWIPTLVGSAVMLAAWPLYAILGQRYGSHGLGVASSVAISAYVLILALWLDRTLGRSARIERGLLDAAWRLALSVALGALAGWGVGRGLPALPPLIAGALAGGAAAGVHLGAAYALGMPEISTLRNLVLRRRR